VAGRRDERYASDLRIRLDHSEGVMRNVSASGVFFTTEADLQPGESFKFVLEFSGLQIGAVSARCEARVVRIEPQGTLKGVGAAFDSIEFLRIPEPA
jgi:hypothetical protein